jgi:hypothetical protein
MFSLKKPEAPSLPGVLRVEPSWSLFLFSAGALAAAFLSLQILAEPSVRLPGSGLLYARYLETCTPDAEQAGMMASRMVAAFAGLGAATAFLLRIPGRGAPDGYRISFLKRRQAYGFVFLLSAGTMAFFLLPEDHRGDPLGCEFALRNQFQFWLGTLSAFGVASGCKLFVDGLQARR